MQKYSYSFWLAVVWIALAALPLLALLLNGKPWPNLLLLFAAILTQIMSLAAYIAFWEDKRRAKADRHRISEFALHVLSVLGGWPGAVIAQQTLRHKSQKVSFRVTLALIITLHVCGCIAACWYTWG